MDIQSKVREALESLELEDIEVRILENRGARVLAAVISPSFDRIEDADRQSMVWGKLLDDLGDDDSRWVEYVFTKSPREVAEDIAEAEAAVPEP